MDTDLFIYSICRYVPSKKLLLSFSNKALDESSLFEGAGKGGGERIESISHLQLNDQR